MSKDEWLQVQNKLSQPYGTVRLTVDGYALALRVYQVKPLKYVIMVFVNGMFKSEWMNGEADECKRFFRPIKRPLYSPAKKKAALKGLNKSALKIIRDEFPDLDKTFTFFDPRWPSFDPLKRHLIANNKSIELAPPTPLELELKALEDDVMVWPEELEAPL